MTPANERARAVADVTAGVVLAFVEIAVPPERVFRALTTDEITQWWGSAELYRTTQYSADLRPGGRWRTDGVGADGSAFYVEGEFLEIDPPRKLVQTWKAAWDGNNETTITYNLEAIEGGTRVTVRHEGFADRRDSCRGHAQGWERVLDWLGKHFVSNEASRFFLVRLLPPRPSFMADMTAEEMDVMRRHAGYWTELLKRGAAIAFGPVADPKGGWGVGILRADSEQAVLEMRDGDPAIQSGRGFSYEVLPMLNAVYRS
jgi:uncharacterized protein YndB with AHSA1/START domain/uncharacterized protein YciI